MFDDHDAFIKAQATLHHHLELLSKLSEDHSMFDPSKLSPQAIREISDLMRTLSPDQMMKLQTLMHNQMAGLNVTQEIMEFEKSMPSDFRAKMARIMYMANGIEVPASTPTPSVEEPKNENEARLVILQSVASGMLSPQEALKVLFP